MALPTNPHLASAAKGLREDLEDVVNNISPYEVPFQSNIGKAKVSAAFHI